MAASGSGGDGSGGDRRHQPNLQGLLKFCVEQTESEDARGMTEIGPMSDERRGFLNNAMQSLQMCDPVKVMLEDLKVIMEGGETDEDKEKNESAMDDLKVHCEDLDLANDFHKIGGFVLLQPLLNNVHSGLRWRSAELIATLAQNNPYCQQALLEANLFPKLIDLLENDENDTVRVKSLYAISCLNREFPPAQELFLKKYDGFSVLVRAMQNDIEKLQLKASFMLASLCQQTPDYKATLLSMGLLDQLVGLLQQPHANFHEHLMRALLVLVEGDASGQEECRRPELGLKTLLEQRLQILNGKDECQEEMDFAQQLLKLCFHGNIGVVDR